MPDLRSVWTLAGARRGVSSVTAPLDALVPSLPWASDDSISHVLSHLLGTKLVLWDSGSLRGLPQTSLPEPRFPLLVLLCVPSVS